MAGAGGANGYPRRDAMFVDASRHVDDLAALAGSLLAKGQPEFAFAFADRRCRLIRPSARDYLLRAEASRLSGFETYALEDLVAAIEADPTDSLVNLAAIGWGPAHGRAEAARRIIDGEDRNPRVLRKALECLLNGGETFASRARNLGGAWTGWLAWTGPKAPTNHLKGLPREAAAAVRADPTHPLASPSYSICEIQAERNGATASGGKSEPNQRSMGKAPLRAGRPGAEGANQNAAELTIIIPIYEDLESTRACLVSLLDQRPPFGHRTVLVDDASPASRLRDYISQFESDERFTIIRNPENLGFAGAVNAALRGCADGDVLLLNSDTVLPENALERLRAVAHSRPGIGTVTPFSNHGEFTSYPKPAEVNPLPAREAIREINRKAWDANGETLVDLPNGIGFCMYITRACLDAVGLLPEAYMQGYYEDVDFCLQAQERGFRNVCAAGVYVGHAGSKSFGSRKRALVMRNLQVLNLRFPNHQKDCSA